MSVLEAAPTVAAVTRSMELAGLAAPGRLMRPSRLYAAVIDTHGASGPRHFLAELPAGAAVFALGAPGVSFLLVEHGISTAEALLASGPIDAAAIDAWYGALLSWPGLVHGDAAAVPMEATVTRTLPEGAMVTAREVVWLKTAKPILRYAATAGAEQASLDW